MVVGGDQHTCAILPSGVTTCWGFNAQGQLGTDPEVIPVSTRVPVAVTFDPTVFGEGASATAITAGGFHTCAILTTGAVACWGFNDNGQLGTDGDDTHVPTKVDFDPAVFGADARAVAVAAGDNHTCAVLSTGAVACWGANLAGEIGVEPLDDFAFRFDQVNSEPALVAFPVDEFGEAVGAVAITAGGLHTCAILTTGATACWGDNFFGQLGDGDASERLDTNHIPLAVDLSGFGPGVTATAIAAGGSHTCAVVSTGALTCWGKNDYGQLGADTDDTPAGTEDPNPTPIDVAIDAAATGVSAGQNHTCAVLSGGTAFCWGLNGNGQLASDENLNFTPHPDPNLVDLRALGGFRDPSVVSIANGANHTCAVLDSGAIACWGDNRRGQVGAELNFEVDATTANPEPAVVDFGPTLIGERPTATGVAAGSFHTCVVLDGDLPDGSIFSDDSVVCSGENGTGELGDGGGTGPGPVSAQLPSEFGTAVATTAGSAHHCALSATGNVACWGPNDLGQLGDDTGIGTSDPNLPTTVDLSPAFGAAGAIAISAGNSYTCAIADTGALACWGDNSSGQLGDPDLGDELTPTPTAVVFPADPFGAGATARSVDGGDQHTCALLNSGDVACWGLNRFGQLGNSADLGTDEPNPVPTQVVFAPTVFGDDARATAIATGDSHTCRDPQHRRRRLLGPEQPRSARQQRQPRHRRTERSPHPGRVRRCRVRRRRPGRPRSRRGAPTPAPSSTPAPPPAGASTTEGNSATRRTRPATSLCRHRSFSRLPRSAPVPVRWPSAPAVPTPARSSTTAPSPAGATTATASSATTWPSAASSLNRPPS